MNLYAFDHSLRIVELGECDCVQALEIFEQCCIADVASYRAAEDAIAATSFGVSRSNNDFIEISCNDDGNITVHSDRLSYQSFLSGLFARKHFSIKGDKDQARVVISDYFNLERDAFEDKYSDYLCR